LQARARRAGWEQALWEGFFRGLGYKHNVWPMQRLGELRPVWGQKPADPVLLQARLLGLSGLLPHELDKSEPELKGYVRELWDHWWRERDKLAEYILPPSIWRFHGMRPSNHPQRRLAMATQLALSGTFVQRLEKWCVESIKPAKLPESLLEALNLQPDPFWSWHATFRSPRMKTSQPILGGTRITDLAINIILPWLWVRAGEGKNAKLQTSIQERFQAWPPAQDNSLLTRLSQLGVDFNYFAGGDR
jgi:hypothetical protein